MSAMIFRNIYRHYHNRLLYFSERNCRFTQVLPSSTKAETKEENDKPIPYLSSEAGRWKAYYTNTGTLHNRPKSEPLVLGACISVFLLYFCILREENDLDDWIRDIETNVPLQVQEYQLRMAITDGLKLKQDVRELRKQLAEVLKQKEAAKAK